MASVAGSSPDVKDGRKPDICDSRNNAAGAFSRLPPELLEMVAQHLDGQAMRSLRQSCKYIVHSTFRHFRECHISTVQTDMSRVSSERLSQLSKHELGQAVRTMIVKKPRRGGLGSGFEWEINGNTIVLPQEGFTRFCEVLGALRNCRSFVFYGRDDEGYPDHAKVDSLTFDVLLGVDSGSRFSQGYGLLEHTDLSYSPVRRPELRAIWSEIESLSIREARVPSDEGHDLVHMLSNAPRLRNLEIRFHTNMRLQVINVILSLKDTFQLEEFRLERARLPESSQYLRDFLTHQPSLRRLYLGDIVLPRASTRD
ncbi:hypothetical protein BDW62DRAFT_197304 [Aspergillus aurantiobrunneus]